MATLEVTGPNGHDWLELEGERITVGRSDNNDLVVKDDDSLSREHAVFERFNTRWFIRDLDSLNGTEVNGKTLTEQRALHNNDEIILGRTKCVFRDHRGIVDPSTKKKARCPQLTPKEKETLVELCRPRFVPTGDEMPAPATRRDIADRMFVGEAAVQAHLGRLYDKFGIFETPGGRRQALANEAIRRRCVTPRDYPTDEDDS